MKKIIIAGRSNITLAKKISKTNKIELAQTGISDFFDGEINIAINSDLKDKEVYILQSTSNPVNNNLMELFLMVDAARRAGSKNITVIIPYFGYSRKEKMSRPGEPISAKVVAEILETIGSSKIVAVDLHSPAVQGFFKIPVLNITCTNLLSDKIKSKHLKNLVVVTPDIGGTKRARNFAELLNAPVAIIEKYRYIDSNDNVKILNIIGDVKDKNAVIVDDLISTGKTLAEAVKLLKKEGVLKIYVVATHLVIPSKAKENLSKLPVEKIIVSDSININKHDYFDKLEIVSISKEIAKSIK